MSLKIAGTTRLQDLLLHLYVLVPVLDNEKHYWVSGDEIDKLLRKGEGWLSTHPEKDLIVSRYLKRQRSLAREALDRLRKTHECVFGVLALESEPIDPRL